MVVPPRNHGALCEAWLKMIEMGSEKRRVLGERARKRIEDHFSIQMIVKRYEQLYEDILLPVKKYRKWDPKN